MSEDYDLMDEDDLDHLAAASDDRRKAERENPAIPMAKVVWNEDPAFSSDAGGWLSGEQWRVVRIAETGVEVQHRDGRLVWLGKTGEITVSDDDA